MIFPSEKAEVEVVTKQQILVIPRELPAATEQTGLSRKCGFLEFRVNKRGKGVKGGF